MGNQNIQDVVTGKVRLSYVHLFTPYAGQQGAEPKYSATILVPKTDIITKQKIDAAINAAVQEGISSKWNGVRPPMLAIPVYDGDGVRPSDGMPFGDECKGHWVFTASSKQAQEIVDANLQRIISETEIYSGIYARVSVRFFAYASNGKNGIGCGLGPVQKLEDGEPLGGRISAAEAFGFNGGGNNPATGQAPLYTAEPPLYAAQPPIYTPQRAAYLPQPVQNQQRPLYNFQSPQYTAQPPVNTLQQPSYQQQAMLLDPITGAPFNGGVMGL